MIDALLRSDVVLDSVQSELALKKASRQREIFDQILKERLEKEDKEDKKLVDACYEMEALFIDTVLKSMRKTILETNFFGKSLAKDIFRDMLYSEYAKIMAKTDQFGLAREIYNQLSVQKTL